MEEKIQDERFLKQILRYSEKITPVLEEIQKSTEHCIQIGTIGKSIHYRGRIWDVRPTNRKENEHGGYDYAGAAKTNFWV